MLQYHVVPAGGGVVWAVSDGGLLAQIKIDQEGYPVTQKLKRVSINRLPHYGGCVRERGII